MRNDFVQDSEEYNSQSLARQAKKGEHSISMMLAIKKDFDQMGDDIVEISTKKESLKYKIESYDENG